MKNDYSKKQSQKYLYSVIEIHTIKLILLIRSHFMYLVSVFLFQNKQVTQLEKAISIEALKGCT